jgi:hypothetical protein
MFLLFQRPECRRAPCFSAIATFILPPNTFISFSTFLFREISLFSGLNAQKIVPY